MGKERKVNVCVCVTFSLSVMELWVDKQTGTQINKQMAKLGVATQTDDKQTQMSKQIKRDIKTSVTSLDKRHSQRHNRCERSENQNNNKATV